MVEWVPTPPTVCGLALALPMDFAAVEAALHGGPWADYVGRAASLGSATRVWEHGFDQVAAAAASLAGEARHIGVVVATNATLADLRALFDACMVVTVIAHWRGPEIATQDIKIDPQSIIERLATERSPTANLIRTGLPPHWSETIARAASGSARRSRLAETLDIRMRIEPAIVPPPDGMTWHMDAITLRHSNRAALDAWWPDAFAAGNRLELADGLQPSDRVASVVPDAWTGIADLSNCQSAQLIDSIKQGRSDRIVVANERETSPLRRMALVSVVYDLLANQPRNYAEVRIALAEALTHEAVAHARRGK